ncbi:MAG: hypothetical protein C4299_04890, partial [Thermoleophilia bacterium]
MARCPVPTHGKGWGDRNPSLSVSEAPDGRILLHCFAGCTLEEILEAIGLEKRDLFPAHGHGPYLDRRPRSQSGNRSLPRSRQEHPPRSRQGHPQEREIAAVYDYVDEENRLLFQVVRYRPKAFAQRRPDGNGGWIWNLDGVRRVLYRLPEVLEGVRAGETIYVVEG